MPNESAFNRRVIEYKLDYKETHIKILSDLDLKGKALEKLIETYGGVEAYIKKDSLFQISYTPVKVEKNASKIIKDMANASSRVNVGPMASVAGAIAESIGKFLLKEGAKEVVVENGGDIFLKLVDEREVGIHAGCSKWSNKIAMRIKPRGTPLGICTSSASVGPSINLGEADAVTVIARSAALADAAATAIGNHVKGKDGVKKAVEFGKKVEGIDGFIIVKGDELAAWGKIPELVKREFKVKR